MSLETIRGNGSSEPIVEAFVRNALAVRTSVDPRLRDATVLAIFENNMGNAIVVGDVFKGLEKRPELSPTWFKCFDSEVLVSRLTKKRSASAAGITSSAAVVGAGNIDGSLVARGTRTSAASRPEMLKHLREVVEGNRLVVHTEVVARVTRDAEAEEDFLDRLAQNEPDTYGRLLAGVSEAAVSRVRVAAANNDTTTLFQQVPHLAPAYVADQRRLALARLRAQMAGFTVYRETKLKANKDPYTTETISGKRSKGAHGGRHDLNMAMALALYAYQLIITKEEAEEVRRFAHLER